MAILLTSTAFKDGESIHPKYTCDSDNLSPPLAWTGIPEEAKSLVLIVDDPDAPIGDWVHWALFDISPMLSALPEGAGQSSSVSNAGTQGINDFRKLGYGGPCPPKGKPHRYFFGFLPWTHY